MAAPLQLISSGLQAWAGKKEADAKADQAQAEALDKERQAEEVEYRAGRNARLIRQQGDQTLSETQAAFAASGVEMSGSALLAMESTQAKINQDVYETYHEARFRATQLRYGAESDRNLSDSLGTAGTISMFGTILGGMARTAQIVQSETASAGAGA